MSNYEKQKVVLYIDASMQTKTGVFKYNQGVISAYKHGLSRPRH